MDPIVEFSPQFESDFLHGKFLLRIRRLFTLALAGAFGFAFVADGDPRFLPFALAAACLALACESLSFVKRAGTGSPLALGFLAFAPWFAFLAAEYFFFPARPASVAFAAAKALPALALFAVAQQQSRGNGSQSRLLAWTLGLLTAGTLVGIARKIGESADFSGRLTADLLAGLFPDVADAGATFILMFFTAAALATQPVEDRDERAKRLFPALAGLLVLGLIFLTRDTAVWLAFLVGALAAATLSVRKKTRRFAAAVALVCAAVVTPIFTRTHFSPPAEIARALSTEIAGTREAFSPTEFPKRAWKIFTENPALGSGTGTFTDAFRAGAPAQWQTRPETANNLYLTTLAENGLVGALALFLPAGLLLVRAVRRCAAIPLERGRHDETGAGRHARLLVAQSLGGVVGVLALFAMSRPDSALTPLLGLAVLGGVLLHETGGARLNRVPAWTPRKISAAFAAAVLVPAAVFALAFPTLHGAAQREIGERALAPFLRDVYVAEDAASSAAALPPEAERALFRAVSARADDADAWLALTRLYALSAYNEPNAAATFARAMELTAENACAAAPGSPEAHLGKAVAQILLEKKAEARASLARAEALAPQDLPLLFQIAEADRALDGATENSFRIAEKLDKTAPNAARVRQLNSVIHIIRGENGARPDDAAQPDRSLFEF